VGGSNTFCTDTKLLPRSTLIFVDIRVGGMPTCLNSFFQEFFGIMRRRHPLGSSRRVWRRHSLAERLHRKRSVWGATYSAHARSLTASHGSILSILDTFLTVTLILTALLVGIHASLYSVTALFVDTKEILVRLALAVVRSIVAVAPVLLAVRASYALTQASITPRPPSRPTAAFGAGLTCLIGGFVLFVLSLGRPVSVALNLTPPSNAIVSMRWLLSNEGLHFALAHISNLTLTLGGLSLLGVAVVVMLPLVMMLRSRLHLARTSVVESLGDRLWVVSAAARKDACPRCGRVNCAHSSGPTARSNTDLSGRPRNPPQSDDPPRL
jgi:hypothetical protein